MDNLDPWILELQSHQKARVTVLDTVGLEVLEEQSQSVSVATVHRAVVLALPQQDSRKSIAMVKWQTFSYLYWTSSISKQRIPRGRHSRQGSNASATSAAALAVFTDLPAGASGGSVTSASNL